MSAYYYKGDDRNHRGDDRYLRGDDRYLRGDDRYLRGDDRYYGGDDRYRGVDERYHDDSRQRVGFVNGPPERVYVESIQKSKNRQKIYLLLALAFFLAAATTFAAVSTSLPPWWVQKKGTPEYEWLQIGLWKYCVKSDPAGGWSCKKYESGMHDTPWNDMGLVQKLMIAGTAVSALAFFFTLITILGRNTPYFKSYIYTVGFLALASAVLFGVCIAYTSEEKTEKKLVPGAVLSSVGADLESSIMFYFACVSAACAFVAVIIPAVFVFISDDYIEETYPDTPANMLQFEKPFTESSRWDDRYNQEIFEREISRRGRNMIHQPENYGRQELAYNDGGYRERYDYNEQPINMRAPARPYLEQRDLEVPRDIPEYRPNLNQERNIRRDRPNYQDTRQTVYRDRGIISSPDYPIDGYEQRMNQVYNNQSYQEAPQPAVISYNRTQVSNFAQPPSYERHQSRNSNYIPMTQVPQSQPNYPFQPAKPYQPPVSQPRMVIMPKQQNTAPPSVQSPPVQPPPVQPRPRPTKEHTKKASKKLNKTAQYMQRAQDRINDPYELYFDSEY
ncbi:uncharacterized protein LOC130612120 [Hydractinia symbiolongicarpus]|uniref:uncharacterized protein LOC130612120 n=1 Tax=Hydractinia symbiolongicarpus TaxID=13093 RepID=UPI002550CFD1|nr:uncharacterized protein LOC130612120 [Hydractinia symbiolongicarpus]